MTPNLILPYGGVLPVFAAEPTFCGHGSIVIGASTIGTRAWLGDDCVIRGDGEMITIGDDIRLGSRSTVHIATDTHATIIGDRVTVGRNAVVHACTVGSDVVIEDDVVILDGSTVGEGVVIEAGATVFPRSSLQAGFVYAGSPAKLAGPITGDERMKRAERLRMAAETARPFGASSQRTDWVFVATTARLEGSIELGAGSSVYFSCALTAEGGSIAVGAETNIQDNAVIRARAADVVIGRDTTVGHNVRMADCRVGARSLIGIGAVLAPGTIVADDVLVAGGSVTEPGQLLEGGWLWGGRPARILAPLDEAKRAMMRRTVEGYREHSRIYRQQQARAV